MAEPAPKIDQRTATDIAAQVQALLETYAPAWKEFDPQTGKPEGVSAALIGIFSRFAEIIIQRLNRVPEKNFLAFLDLLGASLLPPQPARVPLTFSLAAGSSVDGVVPAGTQVAAAPAEGEKEPVIFETERELVVTAARLASVFVRDPEQDMYADHSSITTSEVSSGVLIFQGNRGIEHILYLGHETLFSYPALKELRLSFELEEDIENPDSRTLQWEIWDGMHGIPITPSQDKTENLTKSEDVVFSNLSRFPKQTVYSLKSHWLRCRLLTPITSAIEKQEGMVRTSQLPKLKRVRMETTLEGNDLAVERAFTNAVAIDLDKDFHPFGEKPKFGNTLFLAQAEAFSKNKALVNLHVTCTNLHYLSSAGRTVLPVNPSDDLQLAWECWNGGNWIELGRSTAPPWLTLIELKPLPEKTMNNTIVVEGTVRPGAGVVVNWQTEGDIYVGEDGRFAVRLNLRREQLNVIPFKATLKGRKATAWAVVDRRTGEFPGIILEDSPEVTEQASIKIGGSVTGAMKVIVTNGSTGQEFEATYPAPKFSVTIELVEGRNELLVEAKDNRENTIAAITATIALYASGPGQVKGFSDGTWCFCQGGIVSITLPEQLASIVENGQDRFWLRIRIVSGDYGKEAAYKLKDPTQPAEGFTLVPATFRPPVISSIKIDYTQIQSGLPDPCLTLNDFVYQNTTDANESVTESYEPFQITKDARPTLYLGFTLPPARTAFPNRTISLFNRVADFKYGERSVPISPNHSKKSSDPGSDVIHKFIITNAAPIPANFELAILGTGWVTAVIPQQIDLTGGESQEVEVTAKIPSDTPLGSSDRGFMRLARAEDPKFEYNAAFVTFAGTEFPSGERLQLAWEYWNGTWSRLTVRDESENFTRLGLVQFLAPSDFTSHSEFGLKRYWLRVRWENGEYVIDPRVRRMLLNTTMAAQTVTIPNEILGSSDGSENQTFRTTRAPILLGQQLEIREPELPSTEERAILEKEEGEDAVSISRDTAGRPKEIWVRWHEVPDFYGSEPRARHYVLDHLTGEIRFGNGLNGLIPPTGTGNLRMARYQTGGGIGGNKAADAIVQLKTTVPYVDKVTNPEAATGGANAETLDSLLEQAPRTLRHRGRAVTLEDYEDQAMLASPEVARAKCVPLRSLVDDPLDKKPITPGEVSVIIVPRSKNAKPLPSLELISRVQDHLEANGVPTVNVSVVGPLYVSVNITAEIALASPEGASAVEQAVYQKLVSFLHPLTGGLDGIGWDFGREPHKSDFYALIEGVAGVDHVRAFKVDAIEDHPGIRNTGRFLVYSGKHEISLVFKE